MRVASHHVNRPASGLGESTFYASVKIQVNVPTKKIISDKQDPKRVRKQWMDKGLPRYERIYSGEEIKDGTFLDLEKKGCSV
jgi:hypothetical protein